MYLCLKQDFALTHDMAMIQPSFTSSKWNMGEIFGLKFHLSYLLSSRMNQKKKWLPHVANSKIFFYTTCHRHF